MQRSVLLGLAAVVGIALSVCGPATAQTRFAVDPKTELPLKSGWTTLDLDFDGKPDHILVTYNDAQSAHSNLTYIFTTSDWRTLMFESEGRPVPKTIGFPAIHQTVFSTSQGADYQLTTIRLLVDRKALKTYAVAAFRDFGRTWVDSRPVTFELFELTVVPPDNQTPMAPAEYFRLIGWFTTKKCYPDANFALRDEFGLKLPVYDGVDPKQASLSQPCAK